MSPRSVSLRCALLLLVGQAAPARGQAFHNAVSLHAGVAVPVGTFNNTFNPGPTVNVDIIGAVAPRFAVDLRGGLARFIGSGGAANLNVWDVSINVKVMTIVANPWSFVNGGFGAYRIGSVDWWSGANLGVGAGTPLGGGVDWEATVNYHRAFTPGDDVTYLKIQVGFVKHI